MRKSKLKEIYIFLLIGALSIIINAVFFPLHNANFYPTYGRFSGFYLNPNYAGAMSLMGFALSFGIKNRNENPNFVYDSGIRLNLITDYFEIYFPIYSSLGWEVGQPNYEERIRFLFTLDPGKLLGLFRRKWF